MRTNTQPKLLRNFLGLDGCVTAFGVVESRFDPLFLGRLKVRYFAWHTGDKSLIPTEDLPWSTLMVGVDNGRNSVGPKEGDWVFAIFLDGIIAQKPMVLGVVPGIPEEEAHPEEGFWDPRTDILVGHQVPRNVRSHPVVFDDGTGSAFKELDVVSNFPQNEPQDPKLRYVDNKEATTNRFERHEFIKDTIIDKKVEDIKIGQTNIPHDTGGSLAITHPDSGVGTDNVCAGFYWTEPATSYDATYPYNHAYFSEAGHLIEIDDTPFRERLHIYHRAGSFWEIHPTGLMVRNCVDDEYHCCRESYWKHIEARDIEVVDWYKQLLVNKDEKEGFDYTVTIGKGGDYNLTIHRGHYNKWILDGDRNTRIKKNDNYLIEENELGQIDKNKTILIKKDYHVTVDGDTYIGTKKTNTFLSKDVTKAKAEKDYMIDSDEKFSARSDDDSIIDTKKNAVIRADGDITIQAGGTIILEGLEGVKIKSNEKICVYAQGDVNVGSEENINVAAGDSINETALNKIQEKSEVIYNDPLPVAGGDVDEDLLNKISECVKTELIKALKALKIDFNDDDIWDPKGPEYPEDTWIPERFKNAPPPEFEPTLPIPTACASFPQDEETRPNEAMEDNFKYTAPKKPNVKTKKT